MSGLNARRRAALAILVLGGGLAGWAGAFAQAPSDDAVESPVALLADEEQPAVEPPLGASLEASAGVARSDSAEASGDTASAATTEVVDSTEVVESAEVVESTESTETGETSETAMESAVVPVAPLPAAEQDASDTTPAEELPSGAAQQVGESAADAPQDDATGASEAAAEVASDADLEAPPPQVDGASSTVDEAEVPVVALPKAPHIDLTEPVEESLAQEQEALSDRDAEPLVHAEGDLLVLLGAQVEPGTSTRLSWSPQETFEGIAVPTPVLVVNGAKPGPTLCLTGAVHGDEINGIEVIRRVMYDLNPDDISGAVIGVPIVNQLGFRRNSRYLPDRRDLNRYFPGTPDGSSASRIAYSFFHEVVVNCDMLVDIHTGSFHRTNLPQLRADLKNPAVAEFARAFGDMVVLHGSGQPGTLRREAVEIGIPAVTVEAGEPMRIQEDAVADGVKGIRTLMTSLGMSSRPFFWSRPRPAYYRSYWVRAARGGVLMSSVDLGAQVREGEVLGVVVNPITNQKSEITSPFSGRVIGMALNQVVMPGFAAYHVGIQASEEEMQNLYGNEIEDALETVYRQDLPYPVGVDAPDNTEE